MSQLSNIQPDRIVQQELLSRGIDAKTGVFGEHKVQFGTGLPISLDKITVPSLPYAGFFKATKIARGKEGIERSSVDLLMQLTVPSNKLDAGKILRLLKAGQTHFERLNALGQLTQAQKDDSMWMFTKSVENLSNADLAAVYQSFTSAEIDLLQTALQREGQINPDASDARMAASRLFDLQALVLKEVSNRSAVGLLEDLKANNPNDEELKHIAQTKSLSEQWGTVDNGPRIAQGGPSDLEGLFNVAMDKNDWDNILKEDAANEDPAPSISQPKHDISAANLLTLVEVAAQSSTVREKTAVAQAAKLDRRNLQGVSVKEMADIMRQSELTYNLMPEVLVKHILTNPDKPISNIFHLAEQGLKPKGDAYLAQRDAAEKTLFPELKGHAPRPDERPVYGALNIGKRPIGAVRDDVYGSAAIVFKPSVAKRATYIADDTFFSPPYRITEERKQNFYSLMGDANLPQSLVTALRNPESNERKELEQYFDALAVDPIGTIGNFNKLTNGIGRYLAQNENDKNFFIALMIQCFADKDATRTKMATYDNLESLITNMGDFNGNALANAAMQKRVGGDSGVKLVGAQYIEAQIQGPVVPSRDIAEIRISINDLPQDMDPVQARQLLENFGRKNNIKITIFEDYNAGMASTAEYSILVAEETFNAQHMDRQAVEQLTQDYLDNFDSYMQQNMKMSPEMRDLPPDTLHLQGEALRQAKDKFLNNLHRLMSQPRIGNNPERIVGQSFALAMVDMDLFTRTTILHKHLANLPFAGDTQKAAFVEWISSSTSLQNIEAVLAVHKQATAQAALFREIADANPPMPPEEIVRRMDAITRETQSTLDTASKSRNVRQRINPEVLASNTAYVTRLMLQNGEPQLNAIALQSVFDVLNSKEVRDVTGQLTMVATNPEIAKTEDARRLMILASSMEQSVGNIATYLNREYVPSTLQNISLLPQNLRIVIKEIAPQAGATMDELCPAYVPFPKPAHPEAMPTKEPQRRNFLVKTLDTYMAKEKKGGDFTHGRGHITRAYIFSNAMCNILEEQGVDVDRNAVLCGITGHDLGRLRQGEDEWEEQSAQLTTQAMQKEFGQDSMGEDYETAVGNCILRGKTETVEAMVLKSADSLDIGRTVEFDEQYFPFLGDKNPNKVDANEPDKYTVSSPKVNELRRQLMKEAKILELITDPSTKYRDARIHLMTQFSQGSIHEQHFFYDQYQQIMQDIQTEYKDGWELNSDAFVQKMEDIVLNNADLFPVLSKYYRKN